MGGCEDTSGCTEGKEIIYIPEAASSSLVSIKPVIVASVSCSSTLYQVFRVFSNEAKVGDSPRPTYTPPRASVSGALETGPSLALGTGKPVASGLCWMSSPEASGLNQAERGVG